MNSQRCRLSTFAACALWAGLSALVFAGCLADETRVVEVSSEDRSANILTLQEFVAASTFYGPNGPQYLVEGDIPLRTLQDVERYYYDHYAAETEKLAVRIFNGADEIWPNGDQRFLEYCVSTSFPATGTWSRANTIAAMATAAQRWKTAANIEFRYISSRDSDCLSGSSIPHSRFFKVAPSPLAGAYACAFWPISRNTCAELDGSTVGADTSQTPPVTITRTLTHELGHVLGMIHEYSRNDAPGGCQFQDSHYLTDYDQTSIMQASAGVCGGSPMETLTRLDGNGIRVLYGIPPAWVPVFTNKLL